MAVSTAGMGYVCDGFVAFVMPEELTYLSLGNWPTRNALLYVSEEVLPGVELLTGARFRVALCGSLLSLAPPGAQRIDTLPDVPIQAVFPPEPAIGFEGFGDAAERFEGAAEHIENLHDVFFRCAG